MGDISKLAGINFEEIRKLRAANINTVEDFLSGIDSSPTVWLRNLYQQTSIKHLRLAELVPPARLPVKRLPVKLIEKLAVKALDEAPPDYSWSKRKIFGLRRFWLGLNGHWRGWRKNLSLLIPILLLLIVVMLAWRSLGGFQGLPSPFGLHDRVLIAADDLKAGVAPKADDFYPALLPPQNDYFKPDENLDGLILARDISGQKPLRFDDVLRPQMFAAKNIQSGAIIQKEDVVQTWTVYQPGAALTPEAVCSNKARRAIRQGAIILSEFVEPAK